MKKSEHGIITFVRQVTVESYPGYLIEFNGNAGMLGLSGTKEMIWISAKLAKDLGFIEDEDMLPAKYRELFLGKRIAIVD